VILINELLKEGETYQIDITNDDLFFLCNDSKLFPKETKTRGITDMKMVYVCSPLKANEERSMEDNMNRAKEWCRQASELNVLPLAPHTIFTQYLDDTIPSQRNKGLEMGIELLKQCKEIWVHGNTLSEGMISEIILAKEMNKPIIAKDMDRETYINFMAYQGVFKEAFSNEQWELVCVGLDEGLDVSSYARSNVPADQMMERIAQLKQGIENEPTIIDISERNRFEPEPDNEEDWAQEA
jgi:hypothetical protein